MKKLFIILVCSIVLWACSEEKPGFYEGGDGLCFYYDNSGPYDSDPYPNSWEEGFLWSNALRDTLYFRIMIYGNVSTKERHFALKQSTLSASDSLSYYKTRTVPVAGVNYVAFDDPS